MKKNLFIFVLAGLLTCFGPSSYGMRRILSQEWRKYDKMDQDQLAAIIVRIFETNPEKE